MVLVSEVMTDTVCTVHQDKFVSEIQALMIKRKISGAPVVDDDENMVGFISKTDITHFHSIGGDIDYAKVGEIASRKLFCIAPSASVQTAAQILTENHVHHLIVTEDQRITGILSALDLVQLLVDNICLGRVAA